MNLGATLVAVIVFAVATGVYPTWGWLELPLLVAAAGACSRPGTGMLLSVLFVRYRDVEPIWDVAIQILFYASPILYVATMVPEDYQRVYMFNPLAAVLTQVRHAVVDPSAPTAAELIGGAGWLLVPVAITVVDLRARRLGVPPRGAADRRAPLAQRWNTRCMAPRTRRASAESSPMTP